MSTKTVIARSKATRQSTPSIRKPSPSVIASGARQSKPSIRKPKFDLFSFILRVVTVAAAVITLACIIALILYILVQGVPNLKPSLFSLEYNSDNSSLLPSLITTIYMVILSLVISVPLGVCTAIYLSEYTKTNNRLVQAIRIAAETLAGIPSIIYGLFGMILFVTVLGFGYSLLSGVLTLGIMTLPLIIRTAEEAMIQVPQAMRDGAFALGASKLRTVFQIVLPSAVSGIVSGIILAVGRIVGETAALIFTAGAFQPKVPGSIFDPARSLSVHMYTLSQEGLHNDAAFASAVVLLVLVFLINTLSMSIANKIGKK
jgi:phosphate transport system permease protein